MLLAIKPIFVTNLQFTKLQHKTDALQPPLLQTTANYIAGARQFAMHLYNLTLQSPTAITQAIVGNFSGARQQEIIVSRGTRLELLRPDVQTGKVSTIVASDVFGSIRSLAAFRLTGGTKGEPSYVLSPLLP